MRRPWIKIETATPDKPEICTIATTLRMDADAVLGKLVRLWSWVELNRVSADNLGVTKEFLDKLVGRKGFAAALIACGWLSDTDGHLGLPNLHRHNGGSAKVRALTAQRVALHRRRKQIEALSSVSEALHSKGEVAATALVAHDAENVQSAEESLETSGDSLDGPAQPPSAEDIAPAEDHPVVHSPESPLEEEAHATESDDSTATETAAPEEHPTRKRRSRPAEDPDQPLLF
jgi:hypothetical protein